MVKGNNYQLLIFLMLLTYTTYVIYDYYSWSDQGRLAAAEKHNENTKNKLVNGLIIGGSNGAYSLSARQLSQNFGNNWYNYCLVMEGFTTDEYTKTLLNSFNQNQRDDISKIIVTSRSLIVTSEVADRLDSFLPIEGAPKIDLRPRKSVLSFIKELANQNINNNPPFTGPPPDEFGDYQFNITSKNINKVTKIEIDTINPNEAARLVVHYTKFVQKNFKNAIVYFLYPSGYYKLSNNNSLIESANSVSNAVLKLKTIDLNVSKINFIIQPPYTNDQQLYNTAWHANESGRDWRTLNLINYLSTHKNNGSSLLSVGQ